MLQYISSPPPTHLVPFTKQSYRANAIFTKQGKLEKQSYDWDVLMAYLGELKLVLKDAISLIAALENILLWRRAAIGYSATNFVLWQLLVSYPNFFPASWCLLLVVFLFSTYFTPKARLLLKGF